MSTSFAGVLLPLVILVGTLWGAGALLVACGGIERPSLTAVGIGLVALGHVVKPTS